MLFVIVIFKTHYSKIMLLPVYLFLPNPHSIIHVNACAPQLACGKSMNLRARVIMTQFFSIRTISFLSMYLTLRHNNFNTSNPVSDYQ